MRKIVVVKICRHRKQGVIGNAKDQKQSRQNKKSKSQENVWFSKSKKIEKIDRKKNSYNETEAVLSCNEKGQGLMMSPYGYSKIQKRENGLLNSEEQVMNFNKLVYDEKEWHKPWWWPAYTKSIKQQT